MKLTTANLLYQEIRNAPKLAGRLQSEIARDVGIHQSQVSRIMSGQFKRVSARSIMRLCEFAGINTTLEQPLSERLQSALSGLWDGTASQEEALIGLLRAADALALSRSAKNHKNIGKIQRKVPN